MHSTEPHTNPSVRRATTSTKRKGKSSLILKPENLSTKKYFFLSSLILSQKKRKQFFLVSIDAPVQSASKYSFFLCFLFMLLSTVSLDLLHWGFSHNHQQIENSQTIFMRVYNRKTKCEYQMRLSRARRICVQRKTISYKTLWKSLHPKKKI